MIDIWPLLHGERDSIERAPLLYFDNWYLQCARWMQWKLHIARHNTAAYTPAPPEGRHSFVLPRPELYNLAIDPDESYDVAADNPRMVEQIQEKIAAMLPGFPEEVQRVYAEAKARQTDPNTPAGCIRTRWALRRGSGNTMTRTLVWCLLVFERAQPLTPLLAKFESGDGNTKVRNVPTTGSQVSKSNSLALGFYKRECQEKYLPLRAEAARKSCWHPAPLSHEKPASKARTRSFPCHFSSPLNKFQV